MSKPKRSDLTKAKYEILAFREFETPQTEDRDRLLKPLITDVIGTRSSDVIAERRAYRVADAMLAERNK